MTKARDLADGVINTAELADNAIDASKLNVTGNGTAGQMLTSDGDGSMTWADSASPFAYNAVTGTTPSLDVGTYNFFDNGQLSGDTTLAFTNVPTEARWAYTARGNVGTGYQLSSPTKVGSKDNSSQYQNNAWGFFMKADGTGYYTGGYAGEIYQWDLSTAYDITTTSYVQGYGSSTIWTQSASGIDFEFKSDGTKVFFLEAGGEVDEYNLSTAWDISTATYSATNVTAPNTYSTCYNMRFKPDGTKMFVTGQQGAVFQYTLSTAWDTSTASAGTTANISGTLGNIRGVEFNGNGTKMFVKSYKGNIYEFDLSTAWDVSTFTYNSVFYNFNSFLIDATNSSAHKPFFADSGSKMYLLESYNTTPINTVHQFTTGQGATVSFPASVQNSSTLTPTSSSQHYYEFYTADGGTNVYLINEEVIG